MMEFNLILDLFVDLPGYCICGFNGRDPYAALFQGFDKCFGLGVGLQPTRGSAYTENEDSSR